jgi:hypothetical protein
MADLQSTFRIHDNQETIDDLARSRPFDIEADTAIAAASRLVWLVAIAGAALLKTPELASSLMRRDPSANEKLLLVLPWAFTAFFGIFAHWFFGLVQYREIHYHTLKRAELTALKGNQAPSESHDELMQILEDRTEPLIRERRRVERAIAWARFLESLTLLLLVVSFLLAALYPILAKP